MSFDFHGSWEDVTGVHTPLYSRSNETGNELYLNVVGRTQLVVGNSHEYTECNSRSGCTSTGVHTFLGKEEVETSI